MLISSYDGGHAPIPPWLRLRVMHYMHCAILLQEVVRLSLIAFPLKPKYVTLSDIEWPFYVKFWFCSGTSRICVKITVAHILLAAKCSSRTLVSGDITLYHCIYFVSLIVSTILGE